MNHSDNQENRFIEIYNQFADDIFRFCMVRLRDREKALDATQDVFFKLWNQYKRNRDKIESIDNIKAFLFTITRNTIIDATRKKSSIPFSFLIDQFSEESSVVDPIGFRDTTINPEQRLQMSEITEHLGKLDLHHREILILKFIHDMSIPDIASILGISENTTSVRIHRALDHARKKLSYLYE
jgi:RNA polymerase sigma-70 factor (ECF subfamily)